MEHPHHVQTVGRPNCVSIMITSRALKRLLYLDEASVAGWQALFSKRNPKAA